MTIKLLRVFWLSFSVGVFVAGFTPQPFQALLCFAMIPVALFCAWKRQLDLILQGLVFSLAGVLTRLVIHFV